MAGQRQLSRSTSQHITTMSSSDADSDVGGLTRAKSDYLDTAKLEKTVSKKQMKTAKTSKFYKDLTDALHTKVADFMVGVSELDDDDEVLTLKSDLQRSVEELNCMLKEEAALRSNAERRLEERCDHMDLSLAALTSVRERLDGVERGLDGVQRELSNIEAIRRDLGFMKQEEEKVLAKFNTLAMEFDRQSKAQQNHSASVESLQTAIMNLGNSADKTSREIANMGKKIVACEGQCANVNDHCVQLVEKATDLERKMDTHGKNFSADINTIRNSHESFKADIQDRNDVSLRKIEKLLNDTLAPMHTRIMDCEQSVGEHRDTMTTVHRDLQRDVQKTYEGHFTTLQKKLGDDHARLSRDLGDQLKGTHGRWQQASEDLSGNIQRLERGLTNCESRLGSVDERFQGASKNNDGKINQLMANCKEINAKVDQHTRVNQNLEGLLREVATATDKTQQAVEATGAQLQQVQGRVHQCEKNGQSLEEHSVNQVERTSALERKMGELSTRLKQQLQCSTEEVEQLSSGLEAIQRSWGNAGFCEMTKRKPVLSGPALINEMDGTAGATMGATMGTRRGHA